MHQTLYRKWRPSEFSSVVGQNHVTDILRYQIKNGKASHAYLFCGSRGTGKTTCAKIFAKAVNCLSPQDGNPCGKCESCIAIENGTATDIVEMDAASNNGVEDIRSIRDDVIYMPAFLKKKVYIVDEVHMLSTSAFNALLKTLEEPPEHIVFILATTELQKMPATIISRCQRFDFRRITSNDIAGRLEYIAAKENISLTHEAAQLIGRLSQGGMRDSISLLELCSGASSTVDVALVNSIAGVVGRDAVHSLVKAVSANDCNRIFELIADFSASSIDFSVLWQDLISYYRDMLVMRTSKTAEQYLDLTDDEMNILKADASLFKKEKILRHIGLLEESYLTMQRGNAIKRAIAESVLIKMGDDRLSDDSSSLLSRIASLEEKLSGIGNSREIITADNVISDCHSAVRDAASKEEGSVQTLDTSSVNTEPSTDALSEIDCWSDVIESIELSDDCLASTLKICNAYASSTGILIKAPDEFSKMIVSTESNIKKISSALTAVGAFDANVKSNIRVIKSAAAGNASDSLSSLDI